MRAALALSLAISTASPTALGQIDARVRDAYEELATTGRTPPWFRRAREVEATRELPLLLRLSRPLTTVEQAGLRARGGRLEPARLTGGTPATLGRDAFEWLLGTGAISRASVDLAPPVIARPLVAAARESGVTGARRAFRAATGAELSGEGLVIGDLDTTADVFHPAFFRPMPPTAWVDVDEDGALTPGRDGYDLDGDGAISPREILQLLPSEARGLFSSQILDGTGDPRFDPEWDYLYLDENGDGRRNVGAEVEGAELRPGMGEATFVADDVDGDGVIRQPERLWRLGESKFRAVSHRGRVYRRGQDLSSFSPVVTAADDAAHATAVLGTIAGGQAGASRFLGLAHGADLVLVTTQWDTISLAKKLDWLVSEGASVVVTELGTWGYEVSDGSSELEAAIDAAVTKGTLVVSPAGNLGESAKHAFAEIPADADYVNQAIDLGSNAGSVWASVTWVEGDQPLLARAEIAGQEIDLGGGLAKKIDAGGVIKALHGVTPKGSGYLLVSLTRGAAPALPPSVTLRLRAAGSTPLHASLFILDDVSSWGGGWTWSASTADGTICPPALASKTLSVGAVSLHVGPGFYPDGSGALTLRGFSGRGPDLFGEPAVELVAPDNAIAAYPGAYEPGTTKASRAEAPLAEFGGTSGAGPEVAATAALMFQAHPGEGAAQIRARLLAAAALDPQLAALPEAARGAGRLRIDLPGATASPPTVRLSAPPSARAGDAVTVSAVVTGASSTARARWDVGALGALGPETEELSRTLVQPDGPLDVLVEIVDREGGVARASTRVTLARAPLPAPPSLAAEPAPSEIVAGGGECGVGRARTSATAGLLVAALAIAARARRRRLPVEHEGDVPRRTWRRRRR